MTTKEWFKINLPTIERRAKTPVQAAGGHSSSCQYRVDGKAENMAPKNCCFIGICITPKEYLRYDCEGTPASAVLEMLGVSDNDDGEASTCLDQLQAIHDKRDPSTWEADILAWKEEYAEFLE